MLDIIIDEHAIRIGRHFAVAFHRTLRIPDDGRIYPLPPGLGLLPILKVEDYLDSAPSLWREQGGAFIPMYQREALWLGFNAAPWEPNAVKIAVGRINVISGKPDSGKLHADPQDYVICPDQLWLDGINTGHGSIRQFVAMPLGFGYTLEATLTDTEKFGGIQITVFEPKPGRFPKKPSIQSKLGTEQLATPKPSAAATQQMGLGAGGTMKQKIYPDPHGLDTWDQDVYGRVVIHIVNSAQFLDITGIEPPPTPIDAKTYTEHRLPWFDLYDETKGDIAPPGELIEAKTITTRDRELGEPNEGDTSIDIPEFQIKQLHNDEPEMTHRQSSSCTSTKHSPKKG
ncbi:hypothetical protein SAMN05216419_10741 [Nitrosomonas cryotolerans]|uniref:Integral membrane protein n=1 Tax=Nitrosomonas cryotolerans ATCC 49181 TaxID=1131553 RepID=A0A1N6HVA7_9PROT|nr:hypothetical protein [Nitrosomonas cryotolerans]SFQ14374.1 hypothetical protein SAMN05216419_10741 [Nitrosomonas cryotolerans]SIO23752.1 hypothetical protein SAMN02743940_1383 [Nitrosomonas cryotolerans ATCC 49181]